MARRKLSPEREEFINGLLEHYQPDDAHDVQEMLKGLLSDPTKNGSLQGCVCRGIFKKTWGTDLLMLQQHFLVHFFFQLDISRSQSDYSYDEKEVSYLDEKSIKHFKKAQT